jgi:cyclopropane-fatty-acyl-phospholipid synthase
MSTSRKSTAAERLEPALAAIFGPSLPVRLRAWDGSEVGPPDGPVVVLRTRRALRHLLWAPGELGLARAWVAGDLTVDGELTAALGRILHRFDATGGLRLDAAGRRTVALSAARVGALGPPPRPPAEEMPRLRGERHTARRDAAVIRHHYDVGNAFYERVLGPSMTYSCAYWRHPDDPAATLEQAQADKCALICRKLGLRPGLRLLDVGCGWGTLALHAATEHGVTVVGVTNSREQATYAAKRMSTNGLADLVEIREQDYRDVDDGPFDAIASVGMAEHVGRDRYPAYAARLCALLHPGGRLLNHQITEPPRHTAGGTGPRSFIDAYVFPDGDLLPVGTVAVTLEAAGLEVRDVESLREHYGRTLRAWTANLEANWDECVRLSSLGRARVWRLYMSACALAFERNRVSVHQVLAVRPTAAGVSGMPATRDAMVAG